MLNIQKIFLIFINTFHFNPKEGNSKNVCNIQDKENVVHIGALKQALNHRLILKKVHRVIPFNQKEL